MLAALVGYVGGATFAVEASPKLVSSPKRHRADVSRFAAGASLPVALSGMLNVIPLMPLNLRPRLGGGGMERPIRLGWRACFVGP